MRINKKIAYTVLTASALSFMPQAVKATVYDMGGTGSYGSITYSATGNNTCEKESVNMDCQGWSWIWYEYIGGDEFDGQDIQYTPQISSQSVHTDGDKVIITGDCAHEGSGFYHLGRNAYGDAADTFWTIWDSGTTIQTKWGNYGYRTTSGKYGHRETYSIAYLAGSDGLWYGWAGSKDADGKFNFERNDEFWGNYGLKTTLNNDNLEHFIQAKDSSGQWRDVYAAREYRTTEEVLAEYRRLTLEDEGTARDMPLTNWGFCSANVIDKVQQTYEGSAGISVNDESSDTFLNSSGGLKGNIATAETGDAVTTYTVSTSKIRVKAFAKTWATGEAEFDDTNFTVSLTQNGGMPPLNSKAYPSNKATSDWSGTDSYTTITLIPGIEYTLCSVNNYSTNYDSKATPTFYGAGYADACVIVKYDVECSDFTKADGTKHMVGEHEDYGRMKISTGKGELSVGDGGSSDKDDESYWVTKDDDITLRYYGCMGVQAAHDGGSGGEVVYNIDNNISPLYQNTNNYVALNSHVNQSIGGYELNIVGTKWAANGTNTLADRIHTNYQFGGDSSLAAKTSAQKTATGNQYLKTMSWPKKDGSTKTVSITVKNPYNYYLNPDTTTPDGSELTLGSSISYQVKIDTKGRKNAQTKSNTATEIKANTTQTHAWLFTISEGVSYGDLQSTLSSIATGADGDYFYQSGSTDLPIDKLSNALGGGYTEYASKHGNDMPLGEEIQLDADVDKDSIKVGTKVCAMAAVWPADSHNTNPDDFINYKTWDINSNDQSEALKGDVAGDAPYWRFSVGCRTIGKYPSVSVEGASLVTNGNISTKTTNYKGGAFGGWAEYDIVSTSAKFMGSGASMAYEPAYTQPQPNDKGDVNSSGFRSGERFPQTLGNTTEDKGTNEASEQLALAKKFAENIEGYCYSAPGVPSGKCNFASSVPDDGRGIYIYNGSMPIGSNIENKSKDAVMVIIGDNITIDRSVTRIDAIIIAKNSLDTCNGVNRNNADGNQDLLTYCNTELVINGAVYSAKKPDLKRTYGGGNIEGDTLDASTLLQRAEIFNYDPRIVKISYEINESLDATNASYVKELAPRL